MHLALGGGAVADVLLWGKGYQSVALLMVSTAMWIMFVIAGYNIISFLSNALFYLSVILFFWAKSAALLNRPVPPLLNLEVSEELMVKAADETRFLVNCSLSLAHDIAIGGNLRLAAQVFLSFCLLYGL